MTSLASTLSIVAKGDSGINIDGFVPDKTLLANIEQQVIENFDEFVRTDISVVLASILKLGYTPKLLL